MEDDYAQRGRRPGSGGRRGSDGRGSGRRGRGRGGGGGRQGRGPDRGEPVAPGEGQQQSYHQRYHQGGRGPGGEPGRGQNARGSRNRQQWHDGHAGNTANGSHNHRPYHSSGQLNFQAPERAWFEVQDHKDTAGVRIRILTYNILADSLAYKHHRELYSRIPEHVMRWDARLPRLAEEIASHAPHVVCLQEVDHFEDICNSLKPHGYQGIYIQRTNDRQDGCAMLWRTDSLELIHSHDIQMGQFGLRDNVAQFGLFRCLSEQLQEGQQPAAVLVANTHLLFNPKRGDIKVAQLRLISHTMQQLASQADTPTAAVLVGDCNMTPRSSLYDFIVTGCLDCNSSDRRSLSGQLEHTGRGPMWLSSNSQGHHRQGPVGYTMRPWTSGQGSSRCGDRLGRNGWLEEHLEMATGPMTGAGVPGCHPGQLGQIRSTGRELMCEDGSGSSSVATLGGIRFVSSHMAATGKEPDFTTCHDKTLSTVDFIWVAPGGHLRQLPDANSQPPDDSRLAGMGLEVHVGGVLLPPSVDYLRRGLPSKSIPSDHICQMTELILQR